MARDAGDALVYTEEEKAERNAQITTQTLAWITATSGQNVTRRILALMLAFIWLSQYVAALVLAIMAPWYGYTAVTVMDAAGQLVTRHVNGFEVASAAIGARAIEMNAAMSLILLYYFAAPHIGKGIDVFLDRFVKRDNAAGAK